MPLTPSPEAGPRRRSVLAGTLSTLGPLGTLAALGTATGCSGAQDTQDDAQAVRREDRLRRAAARQSRALLERYEATAAAHAALAARLRPLRAATERHVEALSGRSAGRDGGSAGGERSGNSEDREDGVKDDSRSGAKEPGRAVPRDEEEALSALSEAERHTSRERTAALVNAPPELARLLASVAAAGAVHAYLLDSHGRDGEDDEA